MPDDTTTTTTTTENNNGAGGGTDPTKTETQQPPAFDVTKVGDEDFQKIFEDPRLYNHPRFKSLNEQAKKAKEYEAEKAKAEEEALKKKGEWEAVAKQNEDKAKAAEQKYLDSQTDNRIQAEAVKLGTVDLEAVLKLIDRSTIKVNEDGSITGIEDAVKALLEAKPYLKGSGQQVTVGAGTSPGADATSGLKRFKLSQLQDAAFYQANEKDIMAAQKAHLIEDDVSH